MKKTPPYNKFLEDDEDQTDYENYPNLEGYTDCDLPPNLEYKTKRIKYYDS